MSKLTEYRFYVSYGSGWFKRSICYVGIDRKAIEAKKAEIELEAKSNDDINNVGDITENARSLLWPNWTLGTAGNNFVQGAAIEVGECHIDARCSNSQRFYSMPEHIDEAQKQMDNKRQGQKRAADTYYSQPWV